MRQLRQRQSVRGTARRRLAAENGERQEMATPAQTQRHGIPLLRPHQRSPARNGVIVKSNHAGKSNSRNKGRLKKQAAFPASKYPKTHGRQPRSIMDGVSAFQSYQPPHKTLTPCSQTLMTTPPPARVSWEQQNPCLKF